MLFSFFLEFIFVQQDKQLSLGHTPFLKMMVQKLNEERNAEVDDDERLRDRLERMLK
jgi:hypothetical protein